MSVNAKGILLFYFNASNVHTVFQVRCYESRLWRYR